MVATGPAPLEKDVNLKAFDSVPLFMRSLPEEETDDTAISALQALAHDGTPDEIAQTFKDRGNEYFKGKRVREAAGFYSQAIDARPTDPVLLESLFLNRAACNLQLSNYGKVIRDASKALELNPRSPKALYRSASALTALLKFPEAIDCCDRCLAIDPDNQAVQSIRSRALAMQRSKEEKEKEKLLQEQKQKFEKKKLVSELKARSLIVLSMTESVQESPYTPSFDSDDSMIFPVFFLYPQYATSDVISQFSERDSFFSHISAMFPPEGEAPEWDSNGEYVADNLAVYATTHQKRLLKVGKKMTLRDVFTASNGKNGTIDGLELKNNCLSFAVLPRGGAESKWVEEFKQSR